MSNPFAIWVYLSTQPLLWLTLTLLVWLFADFLARAANRNPLVNPVLISIALMGAILVATGAPYEKYFEGAQFVHFLLGPATVAIAVPLVRHRAQPSPIDLLSAGVRGQLDLHSPALEVLRSSGCRGIGIRDGVDDAPHTGLSKRDGARPRAPGVIARLEGHKGDSTPNVNPRVGRDSEGGQCRQSQPHGESPESR